MPESKLKPERIISILSIVFSLTSLVIVAKMSERQAQNALHNIEPQYIKKSEREIIIEDDTNEGSSEYLHLLEDTDKENKKANIEPTKESVKKIKDIDKEENSKNIDLFEEKIQNLINKNNDQKKANPNNIRTTNQNQKVLVPVKVPASIKQKTNSKENTTSKPEKTTKQTNEKQSKNNSNVAIKNIVVDSIQDESKAYRYENSDNNLKTIYIGAFQEHHKAIQNWFKFKKQTQEILAEEMQSGNKVTYKIDKTTDEKDRPIFKLYVKNISSKTAHTLCNELRNKEEVCQVIN